MAKNRSTATGKKDVIETVPENTSTAIYLADFVSLLDFSNKMLLLTSSITPKLTVISPIVSYIKR